MCVCVCVECRLLQRLHRGYDFESVLGWFADRADMIILLFDAHKLDISDEFRTVINIIKKNQTKIRIVLNNDHHPTADACVRCSNVHGR